MSCFCQWFTGGCRGACAALAGFLIAVGAIFARYLKALICKAIKRK
jgi:hypothetical protein